MTGALALLVFLARRFGRPELFAALMLLAPIVLYVAAMYSGQILLVGPATLPLNISDHLFQARLGADLVAPTTIFVTALVGSVPLITRATRAGASQVFLKRGYSTK